MLLKESKEGGRQATSTDIAQTGGKLGNKEAAQELEAVDSWRSFGFRGVTKSSLSEANTLRGRVNSILGSAQLAEGLLKNPKRLAEMDDDQFGEKVFNALKGIKTAEGVNTISADEAITSYFRADKSLGQLAAHTDNLGDFLKAVARNKFSASQRQKILMDISEMAHDAATHGIARSELRKYGTGRLPEEIDEMGGGK